MKEFKDNSICFIDEFDSQKDIFLNIEIDKFVEDTKDYISIFSKIYAGLHNKEFFKKFEFQKEFKELREHFSKIYIKNNLQYSHKLEDNPSKTNILFKDIEYFSVDEKYYLLETDKKRDTNIIIRTKYDDFVHSKDKSLGLLTTLNDVIVSINYFIARVNRVAQEYHAHNKERLEFTNAISTVLNEVNIPKNDNIHNFLKNRILERNQIKLDNGYYSDWSKNVFYDKGFRYFSFHNSIDFDTKTNIDFKVFENTPEKILAEIAQHTFIVGISATAMNKSVTSNFKLEYLKNKYLKNFSYLSKSELEELKKLYIESKKDTIKNYEVEIIDCNYQKNDIYEFKQEAEELFDDDLEEWIENHQNRYYINRYFKIVKAYLAFTENKDIQSFLCLLTTYPKSESDKYLSGINKEFLNELIQMALKKRKIEFNIEEDLYFIYDSQKTSSEKYEKEIKLKLKEGKKIFLISVYQSLGVGKNIQYKIVEKNKDIEKDFDAIYLDKPTNLLQRLDGENKEIENEKELIKYIYQLETLFSDLQISRKELESSIKSAFNTSFNQRPFSSNFSHKESNDFLYSASKIIIQAVGRLHRTKESSKKFIFIDKELSFLKKYYDENSFNLLSFDAILNEFKNIQTEKKNYTESFIVNEKNFKVRSSIIDSLQTINSYNSNKNNKKIKEWQEIREFVLKNPTLKSIDDEIIDKYELFYFKYKDNFENKQLKYYYKHENDYKKIEVSLESKDRYIEVSAKNAKLDLIRNNPYLKKKFEENNYALYFNTTSLYMMIPIVYNNIYKGALGEKVGKFLLEQGDDLKLLDLDVEEFEKFDYKTDNGVYIDFKYFGESTGKEFNIEQLISKSEKKLNEINAKKAIIINCFGDDNKYINRAIKRDNILVYPFIINTNSQIDYEIIEDIRKEIKNAD